MDDFHGNITGNSIFLSKLLNLSDEGSITDDNVFSYGYRLNYLLEDFMTPREWAKTKMDKLKNNSRILIDPFLVAKINQYGMEFHSDENTKTENDFFTKEDIRVHDFFSIAFLIVSVTVPDIAMVYKFYRDTKNELITFDALKFKQILSRYLETIKHDTKYIKVVKRLFNFDSLGYGKQKFLWI